MVTAGGTSPTCQLVLGRGQVGVAGDHGADDEDVLAEDQVGVLGRRGAGLEDRRLRLRRAVDRALEGGAVEVGREGEGRRRAAGRGVRPGVRIVVSGSGRTVQFQVAAVGEGLPAALTARTRNSCAPTVTSSTSYGDSQEPKRAPSSEHSNPASGSGSFEEKMNSADSSTVVAGGPASIVTSAASTVQVWTGRRRVDGAGGRDGADLAARAARWSGRSSCVRVLAGLRSSSPSSEHSKVAPGSVEEKVKSAIVLSVEAGGPETIVVSGATTVQVWMAGVASKVPNVLTARTRSSCCPTSRPSTTCTVSHELHESPVGSSSAHSKVAVGMFGSLEVNQKVAVELAVVPVGPRRIVVSGTTSAVALTMANGDRAPGSPQTTPGDRVVTTS